MKIKLAKADTESRRKKNETQGIQTSAGKQEITAVSMNVSVVISCLPFPPHSLSPQTRSPENSGKTQFMLAQQKRNVPKGKVASIATSQPLTTETYIEKSNGGEKFRTPDETPQGMAEQQRNKQKNGKMIEIVRRDCPAGTGLRGWTIGLRFGNGRQLDLRTLSMFYGGDRYRPSDRAKKKRRDG